MAVSAYRPPSPLPPALVDIYVTSQDDDNVFTVEIGGTGGRSLGDSDGTTNRPTGIAIDEVAGKIYVANFGTSTVVVANLDGTGAISYDLGGILDSPSGIALAP